ncbi:MAG: DUF3024 domain-containing protein [Pseudomonadales bacterium]|jgi:hypothetical protein|nr:DUF3024 domain-containing protein [Pseudomonadales bacterium]
MNTIPQHTRHLAERLLQRYCGRICPPSTRHVVQLGFELSVDRVILFELRPICGVPGTMRRVPLAQLRYITAHGEWRLYQSDGSSRHELARAASAHWRRYRGAKGGAVLSGSRSILQLLREIDADPAGVFWPRIDGASLRWCSSRGRCAGCDERYAEILGLEARRRAAESPLAAGQSSTYFCCGAVMPANSSASR